METSYDDDPGVRWMVAYQGGDESAFDRLVEAYSAQVFALLTRFLGTRAGREDLVQEVFLRVIRARERYEPTARFSTWLYRIVFNLSVNESAKLDARQKSGVGGKDDGPADVFSDVEDVDAESPMTRLEQGDVVNAVRTAIAALPEQQRMALVLAKYHELPYTEIAAVIGSSEKAVKSLVHRARENLRVALAPYLAQELA